MKELGCYVIAKAGPTLMGCFLGLPGGKYRDKWVIPNNGNLLLGRLEV